MKWTSILLVALTVPSVWASSTRATQSLSNEKNDGRDLQEGDDGETTTCACNGNDARMAGAIPSLDVGKSDLTYPNICLEAAYIALSLVPGTGGEPHKLAMLGAAMYEVYSVLFYMNNDGEDQTTMSNKPLTELGETTKAEEAETMSAKTEEEMVEYLGYTAYGTLRRLLARTPDTMELLDAKMQALGFSPTVLTDHPTTPLVMAVLQKYQLGPIPEFTTTNPPSTQFDADCDTLVDASRWQGQCIPNRENPDAACTPQAIPFLPFDNARLISANGDRITDQVASVPPPPLHTTDDDLFLQEHRATLEASATLDDAKKFSAEYFEPNAALRVGMLTVNEAEARNLSLEDSILLFFAVSGAMRDSIAGSVTLKLMHDTVRPITVLQCRLQGETVKTWSRPYMGVHEYVNEGENLWRPYLQTPPFPGYTSGHAGAAGAGTTMLAKFFPNGMIMGNNCAVQKTGTSRTEPKIEAGETGYIAGVTDVPNQGPETVGFSPAADVTLCFQSYEDFADQLAESRLLGGIHIPIDNSNGLVWGRSIGESFYEYMVEKNIVINIETNAPTTAPAVTENNDPTSTAMKATAVFAIFSAMLVSVM